MRYLFSFKTHQKADSQKIPITNQLVFKWDIFYLQTWLMIFPEGTRYNPLDHKALDKSEKFAEKKGMVEYM